MLTVTERAPFAEEPESSLLDNRAQKDERQSGSRTNTRSQVAEPASSLARGYAPHTPVAVRLEPQQRAELVDNHTADTPNKAWAHSRSAADRTIP